jgi:uncharacterized protein YdcH (DUF465 family)
MDPLSFGNIATIISMGIGGAIGYANLMSRITANEMEIKGLKAENAHLRELIDVNNINLDKRLSGIESGIKELHSLILNSKK